jgi:L-iditol 2-dehydrogenase
VLGHEPVGEVLEAGEGAPVEVGQRVFVHHHVPCFTCPLCLAGRHTLCARFRASRVDPGGLAERLRVPAENLRHDVLVLPPALPDWAATMIEPLACVVRGLRMAGVGSRSRVAVVGAGSMGLSYVQAARAMAAARVVVAEPRADRREIARRLGAEAPEGGADGVREALGGEGADAVFVCTSKPEAIAGALHLAAPGGVVQLFAPTPPGEPVALDLGAIFFREVSVSSTYSAGPLDTREALALLASGAVDAAPLVSHRLPLERVEEAFALARSGRAVKVVVEP